MTKEVDARFRAVVGAITGPGGPLAVTTDAEGRAIVAAAPATLGGFIDYFCASHGDLPALVMGDERISYAELGRLVDRAARALAGRIGKGDRVAIAMRNAPAWIVCYFAVLKAGGVAALVNGWWGPEELRHGMALADPALILADEERARRFAAGDCAVEVVTLAIDRPIEEALTPLLSGPSAEPPSVAPEDDATILFTSGSTGVSKGAVSTHRAVTTATYIFLAMSAGILETHKMDHGPLPEGLQPAILVAVPLFHVTGEVAVLLNSLAIGRKLVMMRKWDAGEALRLIEAEAITYFVGVPTMSLELMQHPDAATRNTSTLMDISSGGAPRPASHVERLVERFPGGHPMQGYGLTETNAVGCTNFRGGYRLKPASTGQAQWPFVEVTILDSASRAALPQGEAGEIAIRTAANFRGYWRNGAATAAAFTGDGWFLTGDLGYLDPEGYLFIVDRAKDIIIRGGENIAAQEVETAIYDHPAVAEATVFALPDERLGEVPGAVVHLKPGAVLDTAALCAFLAERMARFKLPERVWFVAEPLPKLGTGKPDKVAIKARYRGLVLADA